MKHGKVSLKGRADRARIPCCGCQSYRQTRGGTLARRPHKKRIAILGWGSLLWEGGRDFDRQHGRWFSTGPTLRIEFTRVSASRLGALTLVIDPAHGTPMTVAWCLSQRADVKATASDLRTRESTTMANIARLELPNAAPVDGPLAAIATWARRKRLDAVVWTALPSNFSEVVGVGFSVDAVLAYIKNLPPAGKAKAAEYVWRAPAFVRTPLRAALEQEPWFVTPAG